MSASVTTDSCLTDDSVETIETWQSNATVSTYALTGTASDSYSWLDDMLFIYARISSIWEKEWKPSKSIAWSKEAAETIELSSELWREIVVVESHSDRDRKGVSFFSQLAVSGDRWLCKKHRRPIYECKARRSDGDFICDRERDCFRTPKVFATWGGMLMDRPSPDEKDYGWLVNHWAGCSEALEDNKHFRPKHRRRQRKFRPFECPECGERLRRKGLCKRAECVDARKIPWPDYPEYKIPPVYLGRYNAPADLSRV
jgi:hypothetical protein